MARPIAYEGAEPYIFISYAHKDSHRVLPIVSALQERGFRVWYDAGIEAGTEWPEYIAEHLESCTVFLAFLSQSALDSPNCRREITFAIDERKEMLNIYLEELRLSAGMRMQLGVLQAMFYYRHSSQESFLEELCRSRILAPCRGAGLQQSPSQKSIPKEPTPVVSKTKPKNIAAVPVDREPGLEAIAAQFQYKKTADGGIEINKIKDGRRSKVEIPKGVTRIGTDALSYCSQIASVTIPDSVTSIGTRAFACCRNLTDIAIPNSVAIIGSFAFEKCDSLSDITLPDSVTGIGGYAFSECVSLTDMIIPNSVTSIGEYAFSKCKALTSVTLPNGITAIRNATFFFCENLTNVMIPDSVTRIDEYAFIGCAGLTDMIIPDSVTNIGNSAFCKCKNLTGITIPDSVTGIGEGAFEGCKNLTIYGKRGSVAERYAAENKIPFIATADMKAIAALFEYTQADDGGIEISGLKDENSTDIVIPWGVTGIGAKAFYRCEKLTSVTIPDSVTSIGEDAFGLCDNLEELIVGAENANYCSINGILYTKNGETLLTYPSGKGDASFAIPDGVTGIGHSAFCYCENLTSITIPDSVTDIGENAFRGCSKLINLTIPAGITSIHNDTFMECSKLTDITIPDGVTAIGDHAFDWCENLISIIIPDGVTSIGEQAFHWCVNLTGITIPESVTWIGEDAFLLCKKLTIRGKRGSVAEQYATKNRIRFSAICSVAAEPYARKPDLEAIAALFEYRQTDDGGIEITDLKDKNRAAIEIPWGVTKIGAYAFFKCKNMISITIPDSVTRIGGDAFFGCVKLTNITIPDSVTSIGMEAFSGCAKWYKKLTIHGKRGSVAERYAAENKIPFQAI